MLTLCQKQVFHPGKLKNPIPTPHKSVKDMHGSTL